MSFDDEQEIERPIIVHTDKGAVQRVPWWRRGGWAVVSSKEDARPLNLEWTTVLIELGYGLSNVSGTGAAFNDLRTSIAAACVIHAYDPTAEKTLAALGLPDEVLYEMNAAMTKERKRTGNAWSSTRVESGFMRDR